MHRVPPCRPDHQMDRPFDAGVYSGDRNADRGKTYPIYLLEVKSLMICFQYWLKIAGAIKSPK